MGGGGGHNMLHINFTTGLPTLQDQPIMKSSSKLRLSFETMDEQSTSSVE